MVEVDAVMVSWLIIAGVCFLGEMATPQFFLFWFGVGSIAALASHFLGVSYQYQWVVFAVVSAVGLISTRRFAKMILKAEPKKASVGGLIGEVMLVTKGIDNVKGIGQVRGRGDLWKAISEDGSVIGEGSRVRVIRVEGVSLIVRLEEKSGANI